jgi:ATPase subunit of ABC transporter with duplicated ATPase domains
LLARHIKEHEDGLQDVYRKRDAQSKLVAVREVLSNTKTWFHYENGPHAVTAAVMKELTPNVNFFLSKLTAPFIVAADLDSVGFRYKMTNGTPMPDPLPTAKSLSGAQRDMLALSFRLSSYIMFAAKLGMLVLDEPTAHFDTDNVGKFGELLSNIQKIATELDLQILIVSHHSEILPFCDSTLDLGR